GWARASRGSSCTSTLRRRAAWSRRRGRSPRSDPSRGAPRPRCWWGVQPSSSFLCVAEVELEPPRELGNLLVHGGAGRGVERFVLVDGRNPQLSGLVVGFGVKLADEPVADQDRQRVVPPTPLRGGLVHLELVVEAQDLRGPPAVVDQAVQGA